MSRDGLIAAMAFGGLALYVLSQRGLVVEAEDAPVSDAPPVQLGDRATRIAEIVRARFPRAVLDPALALQLVLERTDGSAFPDPALVLAIIEQESGFDPDAVGTSGEIGLMQILPSTAGQFGVTDANALYDPGTNINTGVALLRWLYAFASRRSSTPDLDEIIGAYNAGAGNVWQRGFVPWSYVRSVRKRLERWEGVFTS